MASNVAVVLAGGVGSRVGSTIPKQLIRIAGRTILEHTVAALQQHPSVDEIVVMMAPGHLDAVRAFTRSGTYPKVTHIVEGADTRNGTTQRAIDLVDDGDTKILLHDAVRPLVSHRIIRDAFEALDHHDAVDVAIPSADTIIEVDADNRIKDVPPRANLRRGQTPQAFRAHVIKRAYELAADDDDFVATDDCTVVLRYLPEVPIWVVEGDERNMKITEPIDVYIADKLFQMPTDVPEGDQSFEVVAEILRDKSLVVFGGSYGIGGDIADAAEECGARVLRFSRSNTGTHVERRADVAAAAGLAREQLGRVDFVVNAAGVLPRGPLREASEETVYHATEVNYLAPVFIAQEFVSLLEQTRGGLLFFTSSSYTRGRGDYSLYSSAKAAIVNLTQALSDEWSPMGVRVNCINPERTATPMRARAFGQEPPQTLLDSRAVARQSLATLVSSGTGMVVDIRRHDQL